MVLLVERGGLRTVLLHGGDVVRGGGIWLHCGSKADHDLLLCWLLWLGDGVS